MWAFSQTQTQGNLTRKRFCVNGHDTHVVGRDGGYGCSECRRIRRRKSTAKKERDERIRRAQEKAPSLCWRGHPRPVGARNCRPCLEMTDQDKRDYDELWASPWFTEDGKPIHHRHRFILHELAFFESIGEPLSDEEAAIRLNVTTKTIERARAMGRNAR